MVVCQSLCLCARHYKYVLIVMCMCPLLHICDDAMQNVLELSLCSLLYKCTHCYKYVTMLRKCTGVTSMWKLLSMFLHCYVCVLIATHMQPCYTKCHRVTSMLRMCDHCNTHVYVVMHVYQSLCVSPVVTCVGPLFHICDNVRWNMLELPLCACRYACVHVINICDHVMWNVSELHLCARC